VRACQCALKLTDCFAFPLGGRLGGAEVKLVPVAYGIMKLVISLVVWDDDIMVDDIEEILMEKFGEDIQSVDVAAMSKV